MRLSGRIADRGHAQDRFGQNDELLIAEELRGVDRLERGEGLFDRISLVQGRPLRAIPSPLRARTYENLHRVAPLSASKPVSARRYLFRSNKKWVVA
jgi:hypothetical protein